MTGNRTPPENRGKAGCRQKTSIFKAGYDDHLFMGKRLYADLMDKTGYFDLLARALRGSPLVGDEEELLNALAVIMAVGDPRIWPLKLIRVLSCYDSYATGMSGAFLMQRRAYIGADVVERLGVQMLELMRETDFGRDAPGVSERVTKLYREKELLGYGVPFRPSDERIDQLDALVRKMGRDRGQYWCGYKRIADFVETRFALPANITIGYTAVMLDMGFPANSLGPLLHTLLVPPLLLNAVEESLHGDHFYQRLPAEMFIVQSAGDALQPSPRRAAGHKPLDEKASS